MARTSLPSVTAGIISAAIPTAPRAVTQNVIEQISATTGLSIPPQPRGEDRHGRDHEEHVQSDESVDDDRGDGFRASVLILPGEHDDFDHVAAHDSEGARLKRYPRKPMRRLLENREGMSSARTR